MALLRSKICRLLAVASNWLAWVAAVIVKSFSAYFIHLWNDRIGEHLIYVVVVRTYPPVSL